MMHMPLLLTICAFRKLISAIQIISCTLRGFVILSKNTTSTHIQINSTSGRFLLLKMKPTLTTTRRGLGMVKSSLTHPLSKNQPVRICHSFVNQKRRLRSKMWNFSYPRTITKPLTTQWEPIPLVIQMK